MRVTALLLAVCIGMTVTLAVMIVAPRTVDMPTPDLLPRHPTIQTPLPTTGNGPTGRPALNHAIHRIPTYRAGITRWKVTSRYGHWGTTDWYARVIYIDPNVPVDRLYDVASHEWSHILQAWDYSWHVNAAVRAMNRWYGTSGLYGAEYAADCMALEQGARWTYYTSCRSERWRVGARRLLNHERV